MSSVLKCLIQARVKHRLRQVSIEKVYALKILFYCLALFYILTLPLNCAEVIKVGYFDKKPVIFRSKSGVAQGFAVDILEDLARKKGCKLTFKHGSFSECLEGIRSGKLDLMVPVGYTRKRDVTIDYTKQALLKSWGCLFSKEKGSIKSINDLKGKRIAFVKKSLFYSQFKKLAEDLNIEFTFIEADDYPTMLKGILNGTFDGGVGDRLCLLNIETALGRKISKVFVFHPFSLFMAVPSGDPGNLLPEIDIYLKEGKKNPHSVYYQSFNKWISGGFIPIEPVSFAFMIIFLLIIIFSIFYCISRIPKVRKNFGLAKTVEPRVSINILKASLVLSTVVWLIDFVLEYYLFNRHDSIRQILFPFNDPHEMYMRLIALGAILIGGIVVSRLFARLTVEHRLTAENMRKLDITLDSIGDAVIATDINGNIERLNPVAEKLTGWTQKEAVGVPVDHVFHIIHARTRQDAKNPVEKVIKEGKIVGLANHTKLVSRNGIEYHISDSGAPIRDEAGNIEGVVLVFRNITREYILREHARNMSILVESSASPILMADICGKLTYVNKAFLKTWDYPRKEEVIGRTIDDFWILKDGLSVIIEKLKGHEDYNGVEKARKRDGTDFDVQFSTAAVFEDEGEPVAIMASSVDLTDKKIYEEILRKSEMRYRNIFESSMVGMLMYILKDGELIFTGSNSAASQILGIDTSEFVGKKIEEVFPGLRETEIPEKYKEVAMTGISWSFDQFDYCESDGSCEPDGSCRTFEIKAFQTGENEMVASFSDITERKKAQERLIKAQNYISNIINSMPSVLVGLETDGTVTQWNDEAERLTGINSHQAVGRNIKEVHPEFSLDKSRIYETIRSKKITSQIYQRKNECGRIVYEDMVIYPLVTNGVDGVVVRIDDVTERIRLEELMEQSEKMLSVGGLAAGMAHEINNPLAGMVQTADVLKNRLGKDFPANREIADDVGISLDKIRTYMEKRNIFDMLDDMKQAGARAAEIVKNMLDFARKDSFDSARHDICELVDQIIDLASSDYDLKKKFDFRRIIIEKEYEDDLPSVDCEASKIQQVLLNILRNGAEAMLENTCKNDEKSRGRFLIRISHEEMNGMIKIEIEDNGPGMDEEERKRVFEPFYTTKPVGVGTGLGLSVSYFIISEVHKGSIEVKSVPGKGANFIIRIPVRRDSS